MKWSSVKFVIGNENRSLTRIQEAPRRHLAVGNEGGGLPMNDDRIREKKTRACCGGRKRKSEQELIRVGWGTVQKRSLAVEPDCLVFGGKGGSNLRRSAGSAELRISRCCRRGELAIRKIRPIRSEKGLLGCRGISAALKVKERSLLGRRRNSQTGRIEPPSRAGTFTIYKTRDR